MFSLQKGKQAQEAVLPPRQSPEVIRARVHATEMEAQLHALIAEWNNALRVKADSAAGEEAWHEADLAIERLLKSIPRARISLNRAKMEVLSAERVATTAYTDVVQAHWKQELPQFVEQYLKPCFEAHQRLTSQLEADSANGVPPGALPTLALWLRAPTPTQGSGVAEFLRSLQHEEFYPVGDWTPEK